MIKIKQEQNRKKLNEGRNYGIGFTILKKIDSKNYETYLPFTACKDYLNDFSYVEFEKKEIGEIHGYNHKLLNEFNNTDIFYLGVNTLDYNNGNDWDNKNECKRLLLNNYKVLQRYINNIENQLNLDIQTKIIKYNEGLIVKTPIFWLKKTWLISVYTTIIRCLFNIESFNNDFKNHKTFINDDRYYVNNIIKFIDNITNINYLNLDYQDYFNKEKLLNTNVHNLGIKGFFEKYEKLKLKKNESNRQEILSPIIKNPETGILV